MNADDLHVSIDEEGVVRVTNLGANDAVLINKDVLEQLMTEVYAMAFADLEVERAERKREKGAI